MLSSCAEQQSRFFIFKRYNFETDRYDYYKTDLHSPSHIEEINIVPCVLDDNRVEPIWSPNGKYYGCPAVYNQPLIIYDINNKITAKLEQGNPKWQIFGWSPDSQYAIIATSGTFENPVYELSMMKFDGTEFRQIFKHSGSAATTFGLGGWSPNGEYIVLEVIEDKQGVFIILDKTGKQIASYDISKLTHGNESFAIQMVWSPDIKKLAFSTIYNIESDSKLYVLDIENGEAKDIIPDKSICIMNISGWSSDSKNILFDSIDCKKHILGDYSDNVYYSINADGSELKQLTEKGVGVLYWTLDETSIIFNEYGMQRSMYLMEANGNNKRKILDDGIFVSWIMP